MLTCRPAADWSIEIRWKFSNQIQEFDWWDEIPLGRTHTLAATPARHFSGRGMFDRNKTLWASWVIQGPQHDENWESIHMGPEDAAQPHSDLRGKILFPIHWGTFNLAIHAWTDPVERLLYAAKQKSVPLALPKPGQMLNLAELPLNSYWWRA